MLIGVVLGSVVVVSSSCWPLAWLGLELNLMSFVSVAFASGVNKKCAILYFVVQSCGSLLVVFAGLGCGRGSIWCLLVCCGLLLKIGLIPFHFWVLRVCSFLSRFNFYLLITWQKIAPLALLFCVESSGWWFWVLNAFGGALGIYWSMSLHLLFVFSGLVQLSWVMAVGGSFAWYYLSIYFLVLSGVFLCWDNADLLFSVSLLNAGGLPPFSGFIINIKAIGLLNIHKIVVLLLASGGALISYTRLLVNSRHGGDVSNPWVWFICLVGTV